MASLVVRLLVVGSALVSIAACGGGNAASKVASAPKYEPGSSKCGTAIADWRPLIVEWSAADRAGLEARIREGTIAVRLKGCDIQILPNCKGNSKYVYTATTPKQDVVHIRNADELQATLPFGAARLGSSLQRSGELSVKMSVVGTFAAEQAVAKADDMKGTCDAATHIVSGFATGAFEFATGADATVAANASVQGIGAAGKSSSSHEVLNRDGDEASCRAGKTTDAKPPEGCGAVLRLSLARIECPDGMIYIEGKGCRSDRRDEPSDTDLIDGLEPEQKSAMPKNSLMRHAESDVRRIEALENQFKELPHEAPIWARRAEELKGLWKKFGLKAKFEETSMRKTVLEHGGPATPEETAELERLRKYIARADESVAKYDRILAQ